MGHIGRPRKDVLRAVYVNKWIHSLTPGHTSRHAAPLRSDKTNRLHVEANICIAALDILVPISIRAYAYQARVEILVSATLAIEVTDRVHLWV